MKDIYISLRDKTRDIRHLINFDFIRNLSFTTLCRRTGPLRRQANNGLSIDLAGLTFSKRNKYNHVCHLSVQKWWNIYIIIICKINIAWQGLK